MATFKPSSREPRKYVVGATATSKSNREKRRNFGPEVGFGLFSGALNPQAQWASPAPALGLPENKKGPKTSLSPLSGGAGGNRTRVRKSSKDSSTYLVDLFKFNWSA